MLSYGIPVRLYFYTAPSTGRTPVRHQLMERQLCTFPLRRWTRQRCVAQIFAFFDQKSLFSCHDSPFSPSQHSPSPRHLRVDKDTGGITDDDFPCLPEMQALKFPEQAQRQQEIVERLF